MNEQKIADNQTIPQVDMSLAVYCLQTISVFVLLNTTIIDGDPSDQATIIHKIFETNSSFHVKAAYYRKS